MRMMFKAFAKKIYGAKYERLPRTLFVYLIVFWGLHIADFQIQIASCILYLMISTFTAGVMWQELSSGDNSANMQNLFMLPFERQKFVLAYVAALGTYTFLTKTAALLAIVLAVSVWNWTEILGSILCTINVILMTASIFALRKYWYLSGIWTVVMITACFFLWDRPWFLLLMIANSFLALLLLQGVDGYLFYRQEGNSSRTMKSHKNYSVWRYLFRYLKAHKNYLLNIAVMWGVACLLPFFFKELESLFVVPIGFAILSLNTPICILLSCDPALEQAVRFLPGQKKAFCVSYCLFIFLCNIAANTIFLCSWQIQGGIVTGLIIATAIFFALQSAVCSVLLEWFYPIRGWKMESDLWHHPRKYIVPLAMLLLAGIVGAVPMIVPGLMLLLIAEITGLLFWCGRC